MTYAMQTRALPPSLALEISAILHHLMQNVSDYMIYRSTVRELSALSDRMLADMGLHRSAIRAEARKAAYGV